MAYEYASVGTQRLTAQGYIGSTSPNYAIMLLHVTVVGTYANYLTCYISNIVPTSIANGAATNTTTAYLPLTLLFSGTNTFWNDWDTHYGMLFDQGYPLLHTFTGFSYAIVQYVVLKK